MKKLFILICVLSSLQDTLACDICGCSSGNYFIGPFPQFRKHFFGLRYSFRSFQTNITGDASQYSNDFYQTAEIWGGYNIGKKWQLLAFIPYNINKQSSDDGIKKNNGLGDISIIANYKLFNSRKESRHHNMVSQQLWIGGGIKMPTGRFSPDPEELVPTANNQAGSGSLDFILNAMYTYHINDWGINTNLNYKINTNADDYKYGNRFSASSFVFYSIIRKKATFNPNVGILFEKLNSNKLSKLKIEDTGGNALLVSGGVEINLAKMAIGFNAQLPVAQNISNQQTTAKIRGMAHVTFTF